ncbi:unnamed protein product [Durusdinium trenchii]
MLGRFGAWRSSHNLLGCKVQLDMITYTTAINACETANWQDALGLLVASSQSFSSQDLIAISAAANTLGSRGRWLEVVELLEGGAPVDATAQNIQLSACEKGQEWCQAMDRFQLAAWRGLSSNAICYHATMSACGAREKWQHVLQLFDAFGAQQLQTNIVTYGALLSGLESAAQGSAGSGVRWRQTQEVLCDLYQNQLEINLICTNAAMSACEKGAQWPMASLLLDSLEAVYVETSRISQSSVLSSSMDWALAMRLFLGSETRRFLPSILDFQALLGACSTGGACGVLVRFLPCLRELSFQWVKKGRTTAAQASIGKGLPSVWLLRFVAIGQLSIGGSLRSGDKGCRGRWVGRSDTAYYLVASGGSKPRAIKKSKAEKAEQRVKTKENKEKRKTKVKEKPELEPVAEEHIACAPEAPKEAPDPPEFAATSRLPERLPSSDRWHRATVPQVSYTSPAAKVSTGWKAEDAADGTAAKDLFFWHVEQHKMRETLKVNAPDLQGHRPLHQAVLKKRQEVVAELLRFNADVDARKAETSGLEVHVERSSLHQVWGIRWHPEYLRRQRHILEHVVDDTPLGRWNEEQRAQGREILQPGAELVDVNGQAGAGAQSVLRNAKKVHLLFRQGDPLIGDSVIHLAVRQGDALLLSQLLMAKGDQYALGAHGETAYELAKGQPEILELLTTFGEDKAMRSLSRQVSYECPEVERVGRPKTYVLQDR